MNNQKVIIVGMIYKSTSYLSFMLEQINKFCLSDTKLNVDYVIIANDASTEVLSYLKDHNIQHLIYNDPKPEDYYLNRVYRAWNFGGFNANGDILVFINSDMGFSSDWLDNLLVQLDRTTIPCSRLVESGKLLSGKHAISRNFGRSPDEFNQDNFLAFTNSIKKKECLSGGLYMPCAFYKDDFIRSGGYPEGNVCAGGVGVWKTKCIESGDSWFFKSNPVMSQKKHVTVFDSIVYHIQEGEMDT